MKLSFLCLSACVRGSNISNLLVPKSLDFRADFCEKGMGQFCGASTTAAANQPVNAKLPDRGGQVIKRASGQGETLDQTHSDNGHSSQPDSIVAFAWITLPLGDFAFGSQLLGLYLLLCL